MLKQTAARPKTTCDLRALPRHAGPAAAGIAIGLIAALGLLSGSGSDAVAAPTPPAPGGDAGGAPVAEAGTSEPAGAAETAVRLRPVRITAHSRQVRFGRSIRLKGDDGHRAAGRVRIQFRASGSARWRTRAVVRSRGTGRFRARLRARGSGFLRAVDRAGRASAPARVRVRAVIRLKRPARAVRLGRSLRLGGTVRPRGVRRVRIRVAGAGQAAMVRTRSSGRFAWRWKPERAGDVRFRALAFGDREAGRSRSNRRRSSALRPGGASFYGPGLYGNGVACGGVLRPGTIGVAHKTLPCGTRVKFMYGRRLVTARVIDRGPYVAGRDWDLTEALRNRLGFGGVGTVWTNR